jgi:hypothetical protein
MLIVLLGAGRSLLTGGVTHDDSASEHFGARLFGKFPFQGKARPLNGETDGPVQWRILRNKSPADVLRWDPESPRKWSHPDKGLCPRNHRLDDGSMRQINGVAKRIVLQQGIHFKERADDGGRLLVKLWGLKVFR